MELNIFTMEIAEIKSRLSLSAVLHHYGLKPDKHHRLNCPFHEDKTPSMQLYYKTHTAYCFSANCKTHGKSLDVIDFIMYKENGTKAEAINRAIALISGQTPPIPPTMQEPTKTAILTKMFTYFKNSVHNSKPARDYLQQRGLDFTKLEIGYNTGQFHHGERKEEALINACVKTGLLSPFGVNSRSGGQAYKPFAKECICFALRNKVNQISGLYFRSTTSNSDQRHFYLKDREGLYPHHPKPETKILILTESIIDAATLLQQEENKYEVLALYGTNGLTAEHREALSQLKELEEIIFFLNGDEPGRKATEKHAETLQVLQPKITITKVAVPENEDVNSILLSHEPGIFTHLLEKRTLFFSSENKPVEKEKSLSTVNSQLPALNTENPYKLLYQTPTALYAILGGISRMFDSMKVTLQIQHLQTHQKTRNKLDLYEDKQVEKLSKETSEKLNLRKDFLEADIYKLTDLAQIHREKELITDKEETTGPPQYILTSIEKNQAMEFAGNKNLIEEIRNTLTQTGIVGEEENKIFLYIIAASHIQENPLNALIQGSSGSGKTNLLKGIFKTMPEESKKIYSRCSEKMLYNVPKYYFKNKLICFEDVDGLGEEAEYAWRELVSNGELISGVSYKDEKGNIGIKELTVYGPITSIACTTKGAIYADNMSRLFLIAIDESKAQTQRINEYQAKEASGQINKAAQKKAIQQLQNFSRILQPCKVYNPYATQLKLPEDIQDERRLYKLYLHFIEIITVLHQYQRQKTRDQKLITQKQDCQIARDLMFECIMLKMDELDGSLRQFFERLKDYIHKQNNPGYEFTQREIRETLQVKKTRLSYYLHELISLEYIQQTSTHINKGNRYKILHFDNYRKTREEVKAFLQKQLDNLPNQ